MGFEERAASGRGRIFTIALAAASALALPRTSEAAPDSPATHMTADEARATFVEGTKLYQAGKFAEALARFRAAYAGLPSSRILFNIAAAEAALHKNAAALTDYTRALEDPAGKLSAAERTEAARMIAEITPTVGAIVIEASAPGDVAIDGEAAARGPGAPIFVEPAAHDVALTRNGVPIAAQRVRVAPGERVVVRLEATPAPIAPPPSPPPMVVHVPPTSTIDVPPPPTTSVEPTSRDVARPAGFAALGVGAAAIGAGSVLYWLAGKDYAAMLAATNRNDFYAAQSTGKTKEAAGIGLLIGGGAAVTAGAVLVAVSAARTRAMNVELTTNGLGLWMRGTY